MGGYNPANLDALLAQGPGALGQAQDQNNIRDIVAGGANQPPPANNAKNAGPVKAGLRQVLLGMLQNASYSAGQAGLKAAGLPTDQERMLNNARLAQENAQTKETLSNIQTQDLNRQMVQRRLSAMQSLSQGQSPFTSLGNMNPDEQALANAAHSEAMMKGDAQPIFDAIKQIQNQRAIFGRQNNAAITVDQELAKQYPTLTPYIGKPLKPTEFAGIVRGEGMLNKPVNGAGGPVIVPTAGPNKGQATAITLNGQRVGNPQVEARQAGAYFAAKYGLAQSTDPDGNPVYISKLNAPGAPTNTGALQIMTGKAGLDNYVDALNRVNENLDILNDPSQRAILAQTLRNVGTIHDPGIVSATIGRAISDGLSPKAADLAAAMLQAREFIGANRKFAGNFTGSEALYQRMVANVPGPMNSVELNKALINQDLANTSRIEQRMKAFQGGGRSQNVTPKKSDGFNWGALPTVQK